MKNSNITLNENAIREAAYFIWKNNGCPANTSLQDWNAAINQLTSLATLNSAAKSISSSSKTSSSKTLASFQNNQEKIFQIIFLLVNERLRMRSLFS